MCRQRQELWATVGYMKLCVEEACVVSCVVPVGNVLWMLLQEGRSSKLRLRRGDGLAAHSHNNPLVKCTGVYCAQTRIMMLEMNCI
jgi:hypothetical protein